MLSTMRVGLKSCTPCLATRTILRSPTPIRHRSISSLAKVRSLDHLVLTVKDLSQTIKFYESVLGMKHTSFISGGLERHALVFGQQKINLHISGQEFEPKAQIAQPGSADLCFLVEDDVEHVAKRLYDRRIEVLEGGGVVYRTGARAGLSSLYIRDPDGNLVELSNEVGNSPGFIPEDAPVPTPS
ncbi:Glyoxalase/Bleomycin resistance protein/Dihydroxybiphenyl dioxygenase [Pseudomassariella vexata]|uniref:Glyoxalase/Bleomycin resistance protein/Dihydroxybiphenyl dioxygenase n=1 Tax=Pseudomassariella vexata TaxID=1141098 RepID=A0A1Y2DIV4_9PEZI|nr:Glyoxalase/Bleomycin resistance protein/Dihydroxybiphenyl dioxygenase [Pseudomassariella vexata]ORY59064.1 Glyoxalase/Bleomycin resistance protein/Dihydroxybiphenyl dioxygenase [Pseudomassariella vexata]